MTTRRCKSLLPRKRMILTLAFSRAFYDRRMGQEIDGAVLGEEFKGYIFKITGGNDKQGFPMKQGVLVNGRVRLLLKKSKWLHRCAQAQGAIFFAILLINSKLINNLHRNHHLQTQKNWREKEKVRPRLHLRSRSCRYCPQDRQEG